MNSEKPDVSPQAVSEIYDQHSELFTTLMGGSIHFGFWQDPADSSSMAEASRQMTALMIDKLAVKAGQRVLDVGCGTGRPALDLARSTGVEVVGATISRQQVQLATELAQAEGLHEQVGFQLADAMSLPYEPNSFDAAWLFESLLHMTDRSRVLRQIATVLRPGGRLVIADLVQRGSFTEEQQSTVRAFCQLAQIASLMPLEDYPRLIADSGLLLDELTDISEHSTRQSLSAVHEAIVELASQPIDVPADPAELISQFPAVIAQLTRIPEVGYAIAVASKPQ
ncbi:SAM-dependent methyltransferase [Streptomyces sp. NPDC001719]